MQNLQTKLGRLAIHRDQRIQFIMMRGQKIPEIEKKGVRSIDYWRYENWKIFPKDYWLLLSVNRISWSSGIVLFK